jgi:hypothetical protein
VDFKILTCNFIVSMEEMLVHRAPSTTGAIHRR